jgi:anti-anti-sigma factor
MDFIREDRDGQAFLGIKGSMSVYEAETLHRELAECFDACDGVVVDLNEVSGCDTAGIQLLCSAQMTAKITGKNFTVTGASPSVMETIVRVGLNPDKILEKGEEL